MARFTCETCGVRFDCTHSAKYCPSCREICRVCGAPAFKRSHYCRPCYDKARKLTSATPRRRYPDKYRHCKVCGAPSGQYRTCQACYDASMTPCAGCGAPIHALTLNGRPRQSKLCPACFARSTIPHSKGHRCCVCGVINETVGRYGVCHECRQIKSTCTICGGDMPKYFTRGGLRTVCSARCRLIINKDIITPEKARAAQAKRFAGYVRKGSANHLARFNGDGANWRKAVFLRDDFTCQDCGDKRGPGHPVRLQAHHIQPFATHPNLRYDVANGVTLCYDCHLKRHGGGFGFGGPVSKRRRASHPQLPLF